MFAFEKMVSRVSLFVALGAFASTGFAQADSPVGTWKTIDDKSGDARSIVRISEGGGVISGKIEKILTKGQEDAKCEACEGDLKDKPVTGMTIIQGLKKGPEWYEGGTILDPNNGKTYKAKIRLLDGGKKLEVRGFIGVSLMGRSQTWVRE